MQKIAVLCATMHQNDFSKIKEMNIQTDVVFANQDGRNSCESFVFDGVHTAKMITTDTVGVGINRNIALMSTDADICLMSDDDLEYVDNYEKIVQKAFQDLPKADAIIFNLETSDGKKHGRDLKKIERIKFHNCLNCGAPRIAVRNTTIKKNNIYFNRCFGGGTMFSPGEDTLFMYDMLRAKMKVYTYPCTIAKLHQGTSSWFNDYNEKYFYDRGALFRAISKTFSKFLCLQFLLRHPNIYKKSRFSFFAAYRIMQRGVKGFESLTVYDEHQ